MSRTLVIAQKDLRLILRDRAGLFWIAVFPPLFALLLGAVMERWSARDDLTLSIALADRDGSVDSKAFVARLQASPALRVAAVSESEGRARLVRGDFEALVLLLPGFGNTPDWYSGGSEVIRVEADPSRRREASYLKGVLLEAGLARAIEDNLTADPRTAVRIVPTRGLRNEPTPSELVAPAAVIWGLVGCAAAFAISLASERRQGTLRRLRSLPLTAFQLLFGKALACWAACMSIGFVILLGALLLFDLRLGSKVGLAVSLSTLAFCFTGIMTAISTLGRSEQSVAGAGWGTLLVFGMIGGIMVPRMIMPPWLVSVGAVSPMRWGLLALEHALWRGGGTEAWLAPCALLAGLGVAGLLTGVLVLRSSEA